MSEAINHPQHYGGDTTYEAIKVIEAWNLGFCLGNAVKYICRAGKKERMLEDLKKAQWYLDRQIKTLEANTPPTEGWCSCSSPACRVIGDVLYCEVCGRRPKASTPVHSPIGTYSKEPNE